MLKKQNKLIGKFFMSDQLSSLEEYDAMMKYQMPHLLFDDNSIVNQKRTAFLIKNKTGDEILVINPMGFSDESVLAGLNEKHIEYFAKHAPMEYKKNLLEIFKDKEMLDGVWKIAKSMDEDEGNGTMANQNRIKNVLQYIKDNQVVFIS
jgi:hypothetical protein